MAEMVMKNCKIAVGGYDLSGRLNTFEVGYAAEMLDRTAFNSSFRKRLAGLGDVMISGGGYWGSSQDDKGAYNLVGSTAEPVTIAVTTADTARAFMASKVFSEYTLGGTIGDLLGFDFAGYGDSLLVQGRALAMRRDTTGISSTFASTGSLIGPPTTSQTLYATFHYLGTTQGSTAGINTSGGKIKGWVVASCSSGCGIGSTLVATTMIAISLTTAIGGTWASTKCPSTSKDYFQFRYATTGAKPHLSFICAAGIK